MDPGHKVSTDPHASPQQGSNTGTHEEKSSSRPEASGNQESLPKKRQQRFFTLKLEEDTPSANNKRKTRARNQSKGSSQHPETKHAKTSAGEPCILPAYLDEHDDQHIFFFAATSRPSRQDEQGGQDACDSDGQSSSLIFFLAVRSARVCILCARPDLYLFNHPSQVPLPAVRRMHLLQAPLLLNACHAVRAITWTWTRPIQRLTTSLMQNSSQWSWNFIKHMRLSCLRNSRK